MYRLIGSRIGLGATCEMLPAGAERAAASAFGGRMMAAGPQADPSAGSEPPPDPPGAFASVVAMGSGAVGAVAVAAVGVFGVFQMALYVAEHSGRSMTPKPSAPAEIVVVQPDSSASASAQEQQQRRQ